MPAIENSESSFDEEYVPKLVLEGDSLHHEPGLAPQASTCNEKVDLAQLLETKQEMDSNIAQRLVHHEQVLLKEARERLTHAAQLRAETYDSDESSINTEEDDELEKSGISVKDAQKAFAGLTADTLSDEENIPPILAAVFDPIDKDLTDPKMNPFITEQPAVSTASCSGHPKLDEGPRIRNPKADPWVFNSDDEADPWGYPPCREKAD